jgi:hypothetical protein
MKNRFFIRAACVGGLLIILSGIALTAYLLNERARQSHQAAYEQHIATARLLVNSVIGNVHLKTHTGKGLDAYPEGTPTFQYRLLKPDARGGEYQPEDSYESALLKDFATDRHKNEESRLLSSEGVFQYYGAVRASKSCLGCHPLPQEKEEVGRLGENELMAVVRISMPFTGAK